MVLVNVANADLIEQVLRQEGRHPIRTDMPHWRFYREIRNKAYGPLSQWVESSRRPRSHSSSLNRIELPFGRLEWKRCIFALKEVLVTSLEVS